MTNGNKLTIAGETLPVERTVGVTESSIMAIGQLFSGPAMQALVRLSPHAHTKSSYFASTSILGMVSKCASQEEWEAKIKDFNTRYPDGIVSFGTDCSLVADIVQDLNQLRLLWDNQLITSEAFRQIFAELSELGKTNHRELTMEDAKRHDYGEMEMLGMIQAGIAIRGFNDEMNEKILGALTGRPIIENRA